MTLAHLWPGAWSALLLWALGRLLRRWFDPVPRKTWWATGLVVACLFGPALVGPYTVLPVDRMAGAVPWQALHGDAPRGNPVQSDLTRELTPWQNQVRRAVREGRWPLWDPSASAGLPLLANPQAMAAQPIALLTLPVPMPGAADVQAALRIALAIVFGALFLRRQGFDATVATTGAAAFALGGFAVRFVSWPLANNAALLPLVLFAVASWCDRRRPADAVLLAIGIASVLLAGHPETSLYVLGAGALLTLERMGHAASPMRVARGALLAALLGLGLSLPVLLPTASWLPQTHRAEVLAVRAQAVRDAPPFASWYGSGGGRDATIARLVPLVAPFAYGDSRFGASGYWGVQTINTSAAGFVGSAALLAAIMTCGPVRRRFAYERVMLLLAGVTVVVVALPPGLPWLLAHLPVLGSSPTWHRRLLLVFGFACAYLACCTWRRWRDGQLSPGRVWVVASIVVPVIVWAGLAYPRPEDPGRLWAFRLTMVALQGLASLVAVWLLTRTKGKGRAAAAMAAVVVVELLVMHGPSNPMVPERFYYPDRPALRFLQDNLATQRMVALGSALPPQTATVFGLADIRAAGATRAASMRKLLAPVLDPASLHSDRVTTGDHPLLSLLGVRFVLLRAHGRLPPEARWVHRDPAAFVARRENTLPPLFLPRSVEPAPDTWWRRTATIGDFAAVSLVGPSTEPLGVIRRPWQAQIAVEEVRPTHARATTKLVEARWLASSILQEGGWRMLANGRRVPTTVTNGAFVGGRLEPSTTDVDLVYRPPGLVPGALAAALSLAVLLAWGVRPAIRA